MIERSISKSLFVCLSQVCVTTREMFTLRENNGMMAASTSAPVLMPQ